MQIINTKKELINLLDLNKSKQIGLVPTMGALHLGHISLIKQCRKENDLCIVSIYVNPAQFNSKTDLSNYPRDLKLDSNICKNEGVDIVFAPDDKQIYPNSSDLYALDEIHPIAPKLMGYVFEGYNRPGHFDGMLKIVLKLINLTRANRIYFGKKDAQQLLLVEKMIRDLCLNVSLVRMPLIRDFDNLAFSSRNVLLSKKDREDALCISRAIFKVEELARQGCSNIDTLLQAAKEIIYSCVKKESLEYLSFVDTNMRLTSSLKDSILIIVVNFNGVRLLDNAWF